MEAPTSTSFAAVASSTSVILVTTRSVLSRRPFCPTTANFAYLASFRLAITSSSSAQTTSNCALSSSEILANNEPDRDQQTAHFPDPLHQRHVYGVEDLIKDSFWQTT